MEDEYAERIRGVEVVRWNPSAPGRSGRVDNFGDLLGPMIVRRLTEQFPDAETDRRLVAIGSILQFAASGDVIWGSGMNAKLRPRRIDAARQLDVRAVRGPLTALALEAAGNAVPAVFGDPALLLPALFPEMKAWAAAERKRRSVVEVPNVNDFSPQHHDSASSVSPQGDPMAVIETLLSAEFVVGSSLHAIVVAEAFGIPARLIRSGSEHVVKYVDYYAGTGRRGVAIASSLDDAVRLGGAPAPNWEPGPLMEAFPSDLWFGDRRRPAAPIRSLGAVIAEIAEGALTAEDTDREAWVELARRTVLPVLKDRSHAISGDDLRQTMDAARRLDDAGLLEGVDRRLERTRSLVRLGLADRLLRSAALNEGGHRAVLDSVERAGPDGRLSLGGTVQLPDEYQREVHLRLELADDELRERRAVSAEWIEVDASAGTVRWEAAVDVLSADEGTKVLLVTIESADGEPRQCLVQSSPAVSFPRWWVDRRSYRVDRTRRGNVVLNFEDREAAE